ncbi:NERD domain-containing protein [Nocardia sp. NPDC056064]|uniref:NERD domain-containing protein n=1 Tax=Nocardia sp. NPDC056064 TaxID=3345701 RepID=UPI0035E165F2
MVIVVVADETELEGAEQIVGTAIRDWVSEAGGVAVFRCHVAESRGGSVEVDALVCTPQGVTVVEVKGFTERQAGILATPPNGPWTIDDEPAALYHATRVPNPFVQVRRQVFAVKNLLQQAGIFGWVNAVIALVPQPGSAITLEETRIADGYRAVLVDRDDPTPLHDYFHAETGRTVRLSVHDVARVFTALNLHHLLPAPDALAGQGFPADLDAATTSRPVTPPPVELPEPPAEPVREPSGPPPMTSRIGQSATPAFLAAIDRLAHRPQRADVDVHAEGGQPPAREANPRDRTPGREESAAAAAVPENAAVSVTREEATVEDHTPGAEKSTAGNAMGSSSGPRGESSSAVAGSGDAGDTTPIRSASASSGAEIPPASAGAEAPPAPSKAEAPPAPSETDESSTSSRAEAPPASAGAEALPAPSRGEVVPVPIGAEGSSTSTGAEVPPARSETDEPTTASEAEAPPTSAATTPLASSGAEGSPRTLGADSGEGSSSARPAVGSPVAAPAGVVSLVKSASLGDERAANVSAAAGEQLPDTDDAEGWDDSADDRFENRSAGVGEQVSDADGSSPGEDEADGRFADRSLRPGGQFSESRGGDRWDDGDDWDGYEDDDGPRSGSWRGDDEAPRSGSWHPDHDAPRSDSWHPDGDAPQSDSWHQGDDAPRSGDAAASSRSAGIGAAAGFAAAGAGAAAAGTARRRESSEYSAPQGNTEHWSDWVERDHSARQSASQARRPVGGSWLERWRNRPVRERRQSALRRVRIGPGVALVLFIALFGAGFFAITAVQASRFVMSDYDRMCGENRTPFPNAAEYDRDGPSPIYLSGDLGSMVTRDDARAWRPTDPGTAQLIACMKQLELRELVQTCQYAPEPGEPIGRTVNLFRASYEVVVYELRTGREVARAIMFGDRYSADPANTDPDRCRAAADAPDFLGRRLGQPSAAQVTGFLTPVVHPDR